MSEWIGVDEFGNTLDANVISYANNIKAGFKCDNGHTWYARIVNRTANHAGCPICNKLRFGKSLYDWAIENNDIGDIILKQFAINNIDPKTVSYKSGINYKFICNSCSTIWSTKLLHRTVYGTGCPKCNRASTSFGEQLIYRYYNKIYKNVQNRIKTIDGYEFDIAIFDLNTCIEYNGVGWHSDENTVKRDIEKKELCNKHNIKLIAVWQSSNCMHNTEDIFIDNPRDYDKVSNMISQINKKLDIKDSVKDELLKEAMYEAYKYMNGIDI